MSTGESRAAVHLLSLHRAEYTFPTSGRVYNMSLCRTTSDCSLDDSGGRRWQKQACSACRLCMPPVPRCEIAAVSSPGERKMTDVEKQADAIVHAVGSCAVLAAKRSCHATIIALCSGSKAVFARPFVRLLALPLSLSLSLSPSFLSLLLSFLSLLLSPSLSLPP